MFTFFFFFLDTANCKSKIVGRRWPLLQMDEKVLFFDNVSFIVPGVPLTSNAITLLHRMIILSLFYADLKDTRQSSIKLTPRLAQEIAQPLHNSTALVYENHYHKFVRPNTKVEIFFVFSFSFWFQRNLAKIKQRKQYKNYKIGLYRIEWKLLQQCTGKTQIKIVVQSLSAKDNFIGLLNEDERWPYWFRLFHTLIFK